jgi:hypothetical protein
MSSSCLRPACTARCVYMFIRVVHVRSIAVCEQRRERRVYFSGSLGRAIIHTDPQWRSSISHVPRLHQQLTERTNERTNERSTCEHFLPPHRLGTQTNCDWPCRFTLAIRRQAAIRSSLSRTPTHTTLTSTLQQIDRLGNEIFSKHTPPSSGRTSY